MATGQCLCGKVRYEVEGPFGDVTFCHCQMCRRANGTAFSANSTVPRSGYSLLSGRDVIKEYESSPGEFRAFCSNCGSPVYSRLASRPDHIRLRLGGLSGAFSVNVIGHIWVESKADWYPICDDLPQYEGSFPQDRSPR